MRFICFLYMVLNLLVQEETYTWVCDTQHTTKSICSSSELVKIPNPLSMTTTLVSRKVEASAWLAEAGRS